MKRLAVYLLTGLLVITACTKDNEETGKPPGDGTGVVTPVGTPEEATKAEKVIGAAGGTISSLDGKIKVTVPAGALAANQHITIQRITNNNPMGLRSGYRITPHDVTFAKEVTITFPYTDDDLANTIPEALGIAFQDAEGVWQEIINPVLDKTNKTVSVKTTHFSDWTFFETFKIVSNKRTLAIKEVAQLELWFDADVLASPKNNTRPIGKLEYVGAGFIKSWSLIGAGTLKGKGASATYTAPATVPTSQNPVTITANIDLGVKGTYLVITTIRITGEGEILVRVNGGAWKTYDPSPSVKFADGYYSIANGDDGDEHIFLRWPGGKGFFPYRQPTDVVGTHAQYQIGTTVAYTCSYFQDNQLKASAGGITITEPGQQGGYFEGTFVVEKAGYGEMLKQTAKLEGKFRLKRTW